MYFWGSKRKRRKPLHDFSPGRKLLYYLKGRGGHPYLQKEGEKGPLWRKGKGPAVFAEIQSLLAFGKEFLLREGHCYRDQSFDNNQQK